MTGKQFQSHRCSQFYPDWRAISDTTVYTSANTIVFWSSQNSRRITITALSGTKTSVRFKKLTSACHLAACGRIDRARLSVWALLRTTSAA
jgi:hypothetical protein